ncbi:hypothetical protein PFISCL1PPCAC_20319, partial [Pristionchus fissidentatus]
FGVALRALGSRLILFFEHDRIRDAKNLVIGIIHISLGLSRTRVNTVSNVSENENEKNESDGHYRNGDNHLEW